MASGPDPNRFEPTDPEMDADHYRHGDSVGDLKSTRLGLPSWAAVLVLIAVFVAFMVLTR
jgi:hypothetical protein